MPRRVRCILPGVPCHVTQRGVDRRETFSSDADRETYLRLLRDNLVDADARILGWCLMSNHVHLIAVPARENSLALLLRRTHGRYAQYYNARHGRIGHLWQNRYFACSLGEDHLWTALAYVDNNPVRAGLTPHALDYRWSSASAHSSGSDESGLLDVSWWLREDLIEGWEQVLATENPNVVTELRGCTYAGRPFGDAPFVKAIGDRFGRRWTRGRPPKERSVGRGSEGELPLFGEDADW